MLLECGVVSTRGVGVGGVVVCADGVEGIEGEVSLFLSLMDVY